MSQSQIKSQIVKWLKEADELVNRDDVVQACEKYYKAAEEAVKLLAKELNLKEILEKVAKRKRWSSDILFEAAEMLGPEIYRIWKDAWYLHVYGFHEMKLSKADVENISSTIRNLTYYIST